MSMPISIIPQNVAMIKKSSRIFYAYEGERLSHKKNIWYL